MAVGRLDLSFPRRRNDSFPLAPLALHTKPPFSVKSDQALTRQPDSFSRARSTPSRVAELIHKRSGVQHDLSSVWRVLD